MRVEVPEWRLVSEDLWQRVEMQLLQDKPQELKGRANNVTEVIAAIGHSHSLLAQLATVEAEIEKLDQRLTEMNQSRSLALSIDELATMFSYRTMQ